MHNIIAQIKYNNNIPDKECHLVYKDKILDGDKKISETGLVDESLLQLHMLDMEDIGGRLEGNTSVNDECPADEMEYLAKL